MAQGKLIGQVDLSSLNAVKTFVSKTIVYNEPLILISGRWVIDAKSILGVFSLDLSKPITFEIETEDEAVLADAKKTFKEFII
jgi:phosphotransferase system HPr-like phosphotransfer protein